VPGQNRCRVSEVVPVAVVEGQRQGVAWDLAALHALGELLHRQHYVMAGDMLHAGRKYGCGQRREEGVLLVVDPVEREDREPTWGSRTTGRGGDRFHEAAVVERARQRADRAGPEAHCASRWCWCHSSSISRFQSMSP